MRWSQGWKTNLASSPTPAEAGNGGLRRPLAIDTQTTVTPQVRKLEATANYGKFDIEPLEPGFGTTLGNTLRRVLLSSLWGAAVTSIQVDGVAHEVSAIQHAM